MATPPKKAIMPDIIKTKSMATINELNIVFSKPSGYGSPYEGKNSINEGKRDIS